MDSFLKTVSSLAISPPDAGPAASSWPRMRFGALEDMLVELTGGEQQSVVGRFRKLRLMPFPDAISNGPGNRIEYDLARVLALCTAFELNALLIPQSHAVSIVRSTWPELVRGSIAAAVRLDILDRPEGMPPDMSSIVAIEIDGFARAGDPEATASNLTVRIAGAAQTGRTVAVRFDCAPLVASLAGPPDKKTGYADEVHAAFRDLERTFGWSVGPIPHRALVSELLAGTSFLDRGPYLERAAAFLRIATSLMAAREAEKPVRARSHRAAQSLLDYLGRPSPIDQWKGEIGTEGGRPRLKHYLAAVGEMAGLKPKDRWPETILATTSAAPGEKAAALVDRILAAERDRQAPGDQGGPP